MEMKKLELSIFGLDKPVKEEGFVEIETETGTVELPVFILQGGKGPRLTVVGAQHSCEYCGTDGILALMEDLRRLEPEEMKGSIVLIPVANVPGYPVRALNVSQFDGSNLNRSYPGSPTGSAAQRIAHTIWSIAKTGDFVLDLHGGDMTEDIIQYAEMHLSDDEAVNRKSLELAACFDLENVLFSVAGTEYAYPDFRSLYGLAQENGIPAAIVEAGGSGISDETSIEYFYEGLKNVLMELGFTDKLSVKEGFRGKKESLWVTMGVSCITHRNSWGIFKSWVKAGGRVAKGQEIGQVLDYLGHVVDRVISPRNGIISLVHSPRGKNSEDMIYMILDAEQGERVEI